MALQQSTFDLRSLCERFDGDSRPTFLTLYADLSDPRHGDELDRRRKAVAAAAPEDVDVDALWEAVSRAYAEEKAKDGTRGVAVFAGPRAGSRRTACTSPSRRASSSTRAPTCGPWAEFVQAPEPFLDGVGGVGALLRW